MNKWNITAPKIYMDVIKTSNYFKKNLGQALTVEKNEGRVLRENTFTTWYQEKTRALIFKEGEIGTLSFFVDHYLKKEILGFFLSDDPNSHQYVVEWDNDFIEENGIDIWLSHRLKELDEQLDNKGEKKEEEVSGDAGKLTMNPGGVSWKDIEEYYKKKKNI